MHHRRLGRVGDDEHAVVISEGGRDGLSMRHVGSHPGQAQTQPGEPGRRVRPQAIERSTVTLAPGARLRDHVLVTEQHAAGQSTETLVERHVDGVEQACDLCQRAVVERTRFPQARTVEVDGRASVSGERDLRDEVVPVPAAGPRSRAAAVR